MCAQSGSGRSLSATKPGGVNSMRSSAAFDITLPDGTLLKIGHDIGVRRCDP
jgi:hypothetical protein